MLKFLRFEPLCQTRVFAHHQAIERGPGVWIQLGKEPEDPPQGVLSSKDPSATGSSERHYKGSTRDTDSRGEGSLR